jgi:hypothetical protein
MSKAKEMTMAEMITVECPKCKHRWQVDLSQCDVERTLFKGPQQPEKVEEYRFRCPLDGTYFIVPITRE